MKLTYEDIISQIGQNLGFNAFESSLKANFRLAVRFAEQELYAKSNIHKREESITITPSNTKYDLPYDYNEPAKLIFFDASGNQLESVNTTMEELLSVKNNVDTTEPINNDEIRLSGNSISDIQNDRRYFQKIVYSIDFMDGFYQLVVKPEVTATCKLYYSAIPVDDAYANLKRTPALPDHFHMFIIYGATSYMAGIESARQMRLGNSDVAIYFSRLSKSMEEKFKNQTQEVKASATKQPEPSVIKSFTWFDNPRKYRQGR